MKKLYSREPGVGTWSGIGDGKANKKLRKIDFTKPMENLNRFLEMLHGAMEDENYALSVQTLHQDVTGKFNNIA